MTEYNDGIKKENASEITNRHIQEVIDKVYDPSVIKRHKIVDNVIGFVGGAGGTGTSTIAANVAYELTKRGLSVIIIDMNILYPIMHSMFDLKQEINRDDLLSCLAGRGDISDCLRFNGKIGVLCANNRDIKEYISCENSETCRKNVERMIDAAKVLTDIVIIDCPNMLESSLVNSAIYKCDYMYSVWDEGISCISNIKRFINNAENTGIDGYKIRVIMNKRTSINYPKNIFSKLDVELIYTIPFDTAIIESSLRGNIFCEKGESSSVTAGQFIKGIKDISDIILENSGQIK